jgi:hypothetical protein
MPNRILREGVLTSEPVNSLSWPAEVFYRRLMSVVDDFGRYYAKPELLRAACYPLQLDKVGNQDVAKWLAETQKAGLVMAYTIESKQYLELLNFRQQVRAMRSKFPAPDEQMRSTCIASAHVDGVVVGDEVESSVGKPPPPRDSSELLLTLPLREGGEFEVRQSLVAEVEPLCPAVDVPATLKEMKLWLVGNPDRRKTRKGIKRFITNWLKSEQDKHGR